MKVTYDKTIQKVKKYNLTRRIVSEHHHTFVEDALELFPKHNSKSKSEIKSPMNLSAQGSPGIDLEPVSVKDQNAKIKNMKALMYGSVIERQDLSEEEKLPLIELYHPDASLDEMCHFIVRSKNIQKNENFSKYCVTN